MNKEPNHLQIFFFHTNQITKIEEVLNLEKVYSFNSKKCRSSRLEGYRKLAIMKLGKLPKNYSWWSPLYSKVRESTFQ